MDSSFQSDCAESAAASREMPRYKCHKEVWALKIKSIEQAPANSERQWPSGDWVITPEEDGYAPFRVGRTEYMERCKPQRGGYYVVYEDGYTSYSPAAPFESGYTLIKPSPLPTTYRDPVTESDLAAAAVAPRITPDDIEANIDSEHYFTAADGFRLGWLTDDHPAHETRATVYDIANNVNVRSYASTCASIDAAAGTPRSLGLLTFCVLVLRNGFTVTGQSACASPENFDRDIGRRIARQDAIRQVWPLMGYELRSKLASRAQQGCSPI